MAGLGVAGCGPAAEPGFRLTGFVFDGLRGRRLNFFDATTASTPAGGSVSNVVDNAASGSQIWTLVDGAIVRATPCGQGAASELNGIDASGCYRFEGLPYNAELPVWVQRAGYEPFYGVLTPVARPDVAFSDAQARVVSRSGEATEHVNLRIFPQGTADSLSHNFTFLFDGRGIDAVSVSCAVTPPATITGNFLAPAVVGGSVLEGRSDAAGLVSFSGQQLVPGATYSCSATRQAAYLGRTLSRNFSFTAGISSASTAVDLNASSPVAGSPALYVVSSNVDSPTDNRPGTTSADELGTAVALSRLTVTFNRPVEFVPGTANCQIASLTTADVDGDAVLMSLVVDNPADAERVGETVGVLISADKLTLTLEGRFASADLADIGTTIAYDGIYVRPAEDQDHLEVFTLGGFGGPECGVTSASTLLNARTGATQASFVRLN